MTPMKKIIPQDSYAAALHPTHPMTLSHPDHLYVVGRLHGLTPPKVENARVLELGCGAGGNILPMAATIPGGRFVGIDLSERKIEMAKVAADAGHSQDGLDPWDGATAVTFEPSRSTRKTRIGRAMFLTLISPMSS